MKNKGLTLIEVILSLALIGLITVTFLPMITFGVQNIFKTEDFTKILYKYQKNVEGSISELRDDERDGSTKFTVFGKEVKGHNIHVNDDPSGEVYMFWPKRTDVEPVPEIESPPVIDIRRNGTKITLTPPVIDLLDDAMSLFVREIDITPATSDFYLMSVYRWYMSTEMDISQTPSADPDDYFVVKEWNEAKKQLSFEESQNLKFIPNIKDAYNIMEFSDVQDGLSLSDEDFINTFGNRYIRYGVTPFSLRGVIGKEEISNAVYVSGPRIELLHAVFEGGDRIVLTFKEDITETIDTGNIKLNESIGAPSAVYRDDADYKRLIMEFDSLDTSDEIPSNKLMRGAVLSRQHGRVSIWYNGVVEGEFTIYHAPPVPVTGLTIDDGDNLNIEVGQSLNLTATISPNNATDKTIIWSSSDPDIVSVDDDGLITGVDVGGPVVIKATSANNSGAYDEIDINVIPTEEMAFAELDALLDSINELTVRGPTNTSPVIEAPADSDGVTYRLTSASPTSGTPRIVIKATGKEATVTRHSSSNREGQIRLRASKYGYSRESDAFTVTIPRNRTSGRGAVTVYK